MVTLAGIKLGLYCGRCPHTFYALVRKGIMETTTSWKEIKWECPHCGDSNDLESTAFDYIHETQQKCWKCGEFVMVQE